MDKRKLHITSFIIITVREIKSRRLMQVGCVEPNKKCIKNICWESLWDDTILKNKELI
jgi:hypothetical protein